MKIDFMSNQRSLLMVSNRHGFNDYLVNVFK